jgi:hypothetical protein
MSRRQDHPGLVAGLLGSILATLGIFTLGFVFVPLAGLCALIGLLRGVTGFSLAGIGTSLLAACLCAVGFITSPVLWAMTGGLLAANALTHPQAPQQQQTVTVAKPQPRQQAATPGAEDPMQWAAKVTTQAANECRAKRLRGELPSHTASVKCSNGPMLEAFNSAHYRYMDLIQFFAKKRLEFAAKVDRGEWTEQQADLEGKQIYASIQATEHQRDTAAR